MRWNPFVGIRPFLCAKNRVPVAHLVQYPLERVGQPHSHRRHNLSHKLFLHVGCVSLFLFFFYTFHSDTTSSFILVWLSRNQDASNDRGETRPWRNIICGGDDVSGHRHPCSHGKPLLSQPRRRKMCLWHKHCNWAEHSATINIRFSRWGPAWTRLRLSRPCLDNTCLCLWKGKWHQNEPCCGCHKYLTNSVFFNEATIIVQSYSWIADQRAKRTRKIDLPTSQKGYGSSETTVWKLSAMKIQICPVKFSVIIFDLLIFEISENMAPIKMDPAGLDSPRQILVCRGLRPFWGASDQWQIDF